MRRLGNPQKLLDGRLPCEHMAKAAGKQRAHSAGTCSLGNLLRRGAFADASFELGIHGQDFDDAEPSTIAGHRTVGAANRTVECGARGYESLEPLVHILRHRYEALRTQTAHQPLSDNASKRRCDLVGLHPDVNQAGDGIRSIVRVQSREHQMAGE
jgi:hypothetical protein